MKHFGPRLAALLLAAAGLGGTLPLRAETLGIVLLHGKQGMPGGLTSELAAALGGAGYLVEEPEMCWSRARIYDLAYLDCFRDLDAAVARLKAKGAAAVVVAGQSLGGNAAIAYGARHEELKGVIGLAPAHAPERIARRPEVAQSIARAEALVAAGRGNAREAFADVNLGPFSVTTTAGIYLSFLGPGSPAVIPANAMRLKPPLLWVAGDRDPTQWGPDYAFHKAPPNPLSRYVTVSADHMGTPKAASAAVLAWLATLGPR